MRDSSWGSPDRNPQITSDSTGCSGARGAGTNAGSRQRQRDSAKFDIAESITQLRDGHVPTREHEPSTKAPSACLNAQTREAAIVTVLRRQKPTTPKKRTGYKTSLKRRDHPCCSFREFALSVLKHAGELASAHSQCVCQHET